MPSKEFIKTYRIKTGVIIREVASTRQGDNDRGSTFQIDVMKNGRRIRETLETLAKAKARCEELVRDMKADGVKILALKDPVGYRLSPPKPTFFLRNYGVDSFHPPRIIGANHGNRNVSGLAYGMLVPWGLSAFVFQ